MEANRPFVGAVYGGDHGVLSRLFGADDQCLHQRPADTRTPLVLTDVDGAFYCEAVSGTLHNVTKPTVRSNSNDLAIFHRYEDTLVFG